MGGATVRIKSWGGLVKYQTCLIFAGEVQPILIDSVNIAPASRKIHNYGQEGPSGTPL